MTITVTLAAAALVGLTLGLLGGGGSILTVPALVYLAHVPAKPAIATSLFVVAVTSLAGLATHARAGRVQWRTGVTFAATGMAGAYAGGRLAAYLPDPVLLTGFAVIMAVTAAAMLRPRRDPGPATDPANGQPRTALVAIVGAAVGTVTGLVGAGGGFVIVPALVLFGRLAMPQAVGTSLLVLTAQSAAGFVGHLHAGGIHWPVTIAFATVAALAALGGARWSGRIDAHLLRRTFGGLVAAMAAVVLIGQTPAPWHHPLWISVGIIGGLTATGVAATRHRRRPGIVARPGAPR